jgi:alpha-galactosidase
LAPFLAHPESVVHREHPDWIASMPDGSGPLPGGINEIWGGIVNALDTTHPAVQDHLEELARSLTEAGFTYLKLDFTYAPSFDGRWHDPSRTPAQRVRAGYDAIRRGAGEDAYVLGCGAPLGPCIGVVDGMRIGPDVAPHWAVGTEEWAPAGYRETLPATVNGWQSTLARSFMHRRLWLNDPDCLMLRTAATEMTAQQVEAWADCVATSGGMAIVSDDLTLLGEDARALLDRVIEVGRAVDSAATDGAAPSSPDLIDHRPPEVLDAHGAAAVLRLPADL